MIKTSVKLICNKLLEETRGAVAIVIQSVRVVTFEVQVRMNVAGNLAWVRRRWSGS